MKTAPKLLIGLAAAAAFSLGHPVKANLITNPGFETGDLTRWSIAQTLATTPGQSLHYRLLVGQYESLQYLDRHLGLHRDMGWHLGWLKHFEPHESVFRLHGVHDVSVNPSGVGVPDGGSTVSLLGFAFLGLAALRRKLSC